MTPSDALADRGAPWRAPRGPWNRLFTVDEVPEGAGRLVVLLAACGQPSDADVAWFDDVHVYRLD